MEKKFRFDDKEIGAYLSAVASERAKQKELKRLKSPSFFGKLMSFFMKDSHLLDKSSISMADLPDPEAKLNHASIKLAVQNAVVHILKNKKENRSLLKRVTSMYGLYHHIILEVLRRDRMIIKILEIVYGFMLASFIITFVHLVLPGSASDENQTSSNYTMMMINTLFLILVLSVSLILSHKEEHLGLKTRLCLQHLVYEKLMDSDASFLRHADNNVTYKLLYADFDDYCSYFQTWPVSPIIILVLGIVVFLSASYHDSFLVLLIAIILEIFLNGLLEWAKVKPYLKYKSVTFEHRRVFYEFIANFKTFNLKGLKPRFSNILDKLRRLRQQTLNRLEGLAAVDVGILFNVQAAILLAIGILTGNVISVYWTVTIVSSIILFTVKRCFKQMAAYFHRKFSCKSLDSFFGNDFLAEDIDAGGDEKNGQIEFEECDVLERDEADINLVINHLLIDEALVETNHEISGDAPKGIFSKLKTQLTNMRNKLRSRKYNVRPSKLRMVLSKLNLTIYPGQKVCIFDNKNSKAIKSFISAITRENYIGSGYMKVNGTISVLKIQTTHVLVGKTIRENVLYGNEFNQDRYDLILKALNCQFAAYRGQDMHQVGENALNIRMNDLKMILLARFLYSESDIYIIEDYLTDTHATFVINHISKVFQYLLRGKTILYVSNNIEALKLSNLIISFESETLAHQVETNQYFSFLESEHSLGRRRSIIETIDIEGGGGNVFATKLKNCLFVANISYEEELIIFKQLEKKKNQIEKMKSENKNVLEFISFGFLLAHKRRKEGKYLDDDMTDVDDAYVLKWIKGFMTKTEVLKILIFVSVLCVLPHSLFIVTEFCAFRDFSELSGRSSDTLKYKLKKAAVSLFVLTLSIVLCKVRNLILKSSYLRFLGRVSKSIQESIMDSEMRSILNKRSNRILDCVNKDLMQLERTLPEFLLSMCRLAPEILIDLIMLTYLLSFWSLLIYAGVGFLYYLFLRRISSVYQKTLNLNSLIDYKVDDLNFQLLNLISCMRIGGLIGKLSSRIAKLTDNFVRTRTVNDLRLKTTLISISQVIGIVGLLSLFAIQAIVRYNDKINFTKLPKQHYIWATLIIFRLFGTLMLMPELFQTGLLIRQSCLKLLGFLRKQKPNRMDCGSLRRPDLCRPIVFQRVSVTSGLTPLFKKLNFKINAGQRVGIIGVEGTGRSLLFELITKTTAADNSDDAEIRLFGLRLEEIPESVIKREVFVLEKLPALFEGSIRDNLDPYVSITYDQLYTMMLSLELESLLIDDAEADGGSDDEKKVVLESKVTVGEQLRSFDEIKNLNMSPRNRCKLAEHLHKRSSRGETDKKNQKKDKKFGFTMIRKMFTSSFTGKPTKKIQNGFKFKSKTLGEDDNLENEIYQVYNNISPSNGVTSGIDNGPIKKKKITLSKKRLASALGDKRESIKTEKNAKMEVILNKQTESVNVSSNQVKIEMEPEPERLLTIKTLKKEGSSLKWLGDAEFIHQNTPRTPRSQLNCVEMIEDMSAEDSKKKRIRTRYFNSGGITRTNKSLRKLTNPESIESRPDEPERYLHKALGMASASVRSPSKLFDNSRARLKSFSKNQSTFTRNNQETFQKYGENEQEVDRISQKIFANFLSKKVAFGGKNIDPNIRKLIIYVRAIFAKPKILLLYEEALSFGRGVSFNLQKLSAALKDSTILCITKNNMNLLFYDKVLFFDAGKILEKGNPVALLDNESSFLYQYLAETDRVALQVLKNKRGEVEATKTMLTKTFPVDKSWRESMGGLPVSQIFEEINDLSSKKIESINSLDFKDSKDDLVFSRSLAHLQREAQELSKLDNEEFVEESGVAIYESIEDTVEEWDHEIGEFNQFQDPRKEPDSSSLQKVQLPSSNPISMMKNLPGYICYDGPAGTLSVGSLPDNEGDRLEELDVVPTIKKGVNQLEPKLLTIQEISEQLEMASATIHRSEFSNELKSPQAKKYSTLGIDRLKFNESIYGSAVSRELSNLQVKSKNK